MKRISRSMTWAAAVALLVALAAVLVRGVPAAAEDEIPLSVEMTCSPDTFRPNQWVVVECVTHLTNNGTTPIANIRSRLGRSEGVLPSYFFMLYEINGQPMPVEPLVLELGGREDLPPGETAEVRVVVLLRMPGEGEYSGEWEILVGDELVATTPLHYTASEDAAEPPRDLRVDRELVSEPGGPEVVYQTTVTNEGSSAVTALTLTEHYGKGARMAGAEPAAGEGPPPAGGEQPAAALVTWDLASFGKDSLAPGESLVLRTTYDAPAGVTACTLASTAAMVEATVDGAVQRYGARTEDAVIGTCGGGGDSGGYGGGETDASGGIAPGQARVPALPPSTGEGEAPAAADALPAGAVAAIGLALVGAAQAMRRRAR